MAEAKNVKHVVTNVSGGPRVINAIPGVLLQNGESTDGAVEMTEAEFAVAKSTEWFKFGDKSDARPKPADKAD
ncbi:hypothetical protein D3Y57_19190 [Sphingomonas paeninsulae]|uniref:Uncharacterized protein n=1 Tax=Sphingomonas paeninsulae TaxID=2319844 RepID=A0A494TEG0_SPHPE|nr:hypothetical protein [Sphingomonas paeninsulae]AYJ87660.1 hypothetical protein D3Y57_19190 [Sphingomonas paeninsulae]